jgi:hypothetical protein
MLPVARQSDLHFEEVGDDLVVYDHRTQAAHSLNAAAAYVWEQCDGTRSAAEIAAAARAAGLPWTDATITEAIAQLHAKNLVEPTAVASSPTPRITRRVLTKAAVAALVPAIVSIATPAAALVLSTAHNGNRVPGATA